MVLLFNLYLDNTRWFLTEYSDEDDVLRCTSVDFEIVLKEIYERVEFQET
jgi:hypothetical protein